VTRDLPEGERKLLWTFLDSPLEENARPAALRAEAAPESKQPRRDIQALSRLARS
jgi:hypothetical protein